MSNRMPSPEELEERRMAFNKFYRENLLDLVQKLPLNHQNKMHESIKRAFNAGTNFERRKNDVIYSGGNN
jgi:hypothetical protein